MCRRLKVSNEMVQVSAPRNAPGRSWPRAKCSGARPRPRRDRTSSVDDYTAEVKVTNTSRSTITHITGYHSRCAVRQSYGCVQYIVLIAPYEQDTDPKAPCYQAAATLKVTGVADNSIQVEGSGLLRDHPQGVSRTAPSFISTGVNRSQRS